MKKKVNQADELNILCLEDSPKDAEIMQELLINAGFVINVDCTDKEKEFVSLLRSKRHNLILSDFKLPGFDGFTALKWSVEICPEVPFICVSGTVGEEIAVDLLKQGAVDYILKDRLEKLPFVIKRALNDVREKKARRMAEEALSISELRYRRLFESSKDGILILDAESGMIIDVNPFLVELLGYSTEQFHGKKVWETGIFDDLIGNKETFLELKKKKFIRYDDFPLKTINGRQISIEFVSNVYLVDNVKVIQCNIRDITERKLAEETIQKERTLLRTIIDNLPVGIFVKDKDYKKIIVNPIHLNELKGHLKYLGKNSEIDILGKTDFEVFPKELAQKFLIEDQKVIRDGSLVLNDEGIGFSEKGNQLCLLVSKIPLRDNKGEIIGMVGVAADITERKKTEEELKKSEKLLESVFNATEDLILVVDKDLKIIKSNWKSPIYEGCTEFPSGSRCYKAFIHRDTPCEPCHAYDVFNTGKSVLVEYYNQYTKLFKEITACPIFDNNNNVIAVVENVRDITERKLAEDKLKKSEEKYRSIFENVQDVYYETSFDGIILEVSPSIALVSKGQYNQEDLIGKSMYELYADPKDRDNIISVIQKTGSVSDFEVRLRNRDNSLIFCSFSAKIKFDTQGQPEKIIGSMHDITKRKQAEEELQFRNTILSTQQEVSMDGILVVDENGKIISFNRNFVNIWNIPDDLIKSKYDKPVLEFVTDKLVNPEEFINRVEYLYNHRKEISREEIVFKDGRTFDRYSAPMFGSDKKYYGRVWYFRDITESKQAEKKILGLNRTLAVLSNINQLIIHEHDKQKLFDSVCKIAVGDGKFLMSWIGITDENTGLVEPVASAGKTERYLEQLQINISDKPEGRGPTATALQKGNSVICNFIKNKNKKEPWEERAHAIGYRASAAFPLIVSSKVIGTLNFYSGEAGFFIEEEVRLIEELAANVSFALESIKQEEIRKETEKKLKKNEALVQTAIENLPLIFYMIEPDGKFNLSIGAGLKGLGLKQNEVVGQSVYDIYKEFPEITDSINNALAGEPVYFDSKVSNSTFINYVVPFTLIQGEPSWLIGVALDITNLKQAEEALRESEAKLTEAMKIAKLCTWEYSVAQDQFTFNEQFYTLLNTTYEEEGGFIMSSGQYAQKFVHPDDMALVGIEIKKALETTDSNYHSQVDHRIICADGEIKFVTVRIRVEKDVKGRTVKTRGVNQDITERKLAEDTITKERTLLKTLIDNLPSAVFVKDKNYRKIAANTLHKSSIAGHLKSLGVDFNMDIIGKTDFDIFPKEKAEKYFADDQKVIVNGEFLINKEEEGVSPNGKKVCLLVSKIPLRNIKGEIEGMIGITTDITDIKQTSEALASEQYLMHALMDNVPDRIYFKDMASRFIRISRAQAQLFGLRDTANAVDKSDFDFFSEEHARQAYEDEQEIICTGQSISKEERETWSDRPDTWVHTTKLPLKDKEGKIIGTFGISLDITVIKETELMLTQKNQEIESQNEEYLALNDELEQTNKELMLAKEKAEESDKLKTAFLQNMSHEIRTPMNGILGFAELLRTPNLPEKKQMEFLFIIEKSGRRMLNIINDIVNISKIETGQIELDLQETNVNELLQHLHAFFNHEAEKKGLNLNFNSGLSDESCKIETDGVKLTQVISNLISNALKFTNSGAIDFGYLQKGNMLEFYVKDTGIGIAQESHEVIFERFRQVEISAARSYEGAGLGLSISRAFIEKLGGTIWVNSELGKGAVFLFNIPNIQKVKINTEKQMETSANSKLSHINILIVEDDDVCMELLKVVLEDEKANLFFANNGQEAFDIVNSTPEIQIVLMDLKMPVMNGFEATRLIKKIKPGLPVIAQSAYAFSNDQDKARIAGCDDFIGKPVVRELLLSKINKQLAKSLSFGK